MNTETTRLARYIKKAQDHPIASWVIFGGMCLTALAAFSIQMDSWYTTIEKRIAPETSTKTIENEVTAATTNGTKKPTEDVQKSPEATSPTCNECLDLFTRARTDIKQGRVSKPAGDNAYEKYLKLLPLDVNQAKTLFEEIQEELKRLIDLEIRRKNTSIALRHIETLRSIDKTYNAKLDLVAISKFRQPVDSELKKPNKTKTPEPNTSTQILNPSLVNEATSKNHLSEAPKQEVLVKSNQDIDNHQKITEQSTDNLESNWANLACTAISKNLIDNSKLTALRTIIQDKETISTKEILKVYKCSRLLIDSSKITLLTVLTGRKVVGKFSESEYDSILNDLLIDNSRNAATAILSRMLQ